MDARRVVVCRCEDVSLADVLEAIRDGCCDLESLKRRLRIGMGACQGSHCLSIVARILARETKCSPDELYIPVNRPPLSPVPFKYFLKSGEKQGV